jgi:hypothetical protein
MLDGVSIIGLTPAGLLLIVVLMVLTGRLIPRATYLEKVREAAQWRAAYEASEKARSMSDSQTRELLEVAKTSERFLSAVVETSTHIIKSGDS